MSDATANMKRLLEALYLKSLKQEVEWEFFPSLDLCEAKLGSGFVQVVSEADDEGNYYSFVRILDSEKTVVDNIYGGNFGIQSKPYNTDHKNYWDLMRDLYSVSKRSALGADKLVSSIVDSLGASNLSISEDDVPF